MTEQTPAQQTAGPWNLIIFLGVAAALVVAVLAMVTHGFHTKSGDAKRACEHTISDRLTAPSTAKFSSVIVTETTGSYRVTGSVDAENGFGAPVRSFFGCTLHSSAGEWVTDDVTLI